MLMLIYSMKPGHDGSVALIDTDTQDLIRATGRGQKRYSKQILQMKQ